MVPFVAGIARALCELSGALVHLSSVVASDIAQVVDCWSYWAAGHSDGALPHALVQEPSPPFRGSDVLHEHHELALLANNRQGE